MKTKILLTFLIFFSTLLILNAQLSNWEWARASGGIRSQEGLSVSVDVFGNSYITGFFDSTITFGTNTDTANTQNWKIFLTKFDPGGTVIWSKSFGGIGRASGKKLSIDQSGNIYMLGVFDSTITIGSITLTSTTSSNFLAKFDSNGDIIWAEIIGAGLYIYPISMTTDLDGNAIIAGIFNGTIAFGSYTFTCLDAPGGNDIFIVKYNNSGNLMWAIRAGSIEDEWCNDVSTDFNGNIYITGSYTPLSNPSFGSITLPATGSYDSYLTKYDNNGIVIWAQSVGGDGYETGVGVSNDAQGNIYLLGDFKIDSLTIGSDILTPIGQWDIFIAKFNPNGTPIWARKSGGIYNDQSRAIASDASGNTYIVGAIWDTVFYFGGFTLQRPLNSWDPMFFLKYDTNGNEIDGTILQNGGDDYIGISTDNVGDAFITGDFVNSPFIIGNDSLFPVPVLTSETIFIAKYGLTVGIPQSALANQKSALHLSPNPCTNELQITNYELGIKEIKIFNLLGECKWQSEIHNPKSLPDRQAGEISVDVSALAKGLYFVEVYSLPELSRRDDGRVMRKKFVKQ